MPARLLAIAVALVGCSTIQSAAQTPIRFTLDWGIDGPAAPFLLARERGYFADEGLRVTIDTGSGSIEPINRVASRAYDMGFGDINAAIKFNDRNPDTPIRPVYMVYNKPAFAIIGRKSHGIFMPRDLEGRRLGAPIGDASYTQWPIFVQANGIDADTVSIDNVGFPVRAPMLASGRVDAVTGFTLSAPFNLRASGVPSDDITTFLMADYGVDLYGNAIIASPSFAERNPEAVRGFLRAFNRALKETAADPEDAIDYVMASNALLDRATELEKLKLALDQNIMTDEVRANGLGAIAQDRMAEAIEQIALTFTFASTPTADIVFDPSFLPEAAERAIE